MQMFDKVFEWMKPKVDVINQILQYQIEIYDQAKNLIKQCANTKSMQEFYCPNCQSFKLDCAACFDNNKIGRCDNHVRVNIKKYIQQQISEYKNIVLSFQNAQKSVQDQKSKSESLILNQITQAHHKNKQLYNQFRKLYQEAHLTYLENLNKIKSQDEEKLKQKKNMVMNNTQSNDQKYMFWFNKNSQNIFKLALKTPIQQIHTRIMQLKKKKQQQQKSLQQSYYKCVIQNSLFKYNSINNIQKIELIKLEKIQQTNKVKAELQNQVQKLKYQYQQKMKQLEQLFNQNQKLAGQIKQYDLREYQQRINLQEKQFENKLISLQKQNQQLKILNEELKQRLDRISHQNKSLQTKLLSQEQKNWLLENIKSKISYSKIKLIFVASDYKFKSEEFHRLCDEKQNLLVIIKCQDVSNKPGNILGGFTKYKFGAIGDLNTAFMFSVTHSSIMNLNQGKKATQCNKQYGPIFGDDLKIRSDRIYSNYHLIKTSYEKKVEVSQDYLCGGIEVPIEEYEVHQLIL